MNKKGPNRRLSLLSRDVTGQIKRKHRKDLKDKWLEFYALYTVTKQQIWMVTAPKGSGKNCNKSGGYTPTAK